MRTDSLRVMPDKLEIGNVKARTPRHVPFLAVKYKLRGVRLKHSRNIPERYNLLLWMGNKYWVNIYSTHSGEYLKVDVYDKAGIEFGKLY